jgi:hypothetical protein
VRETGRYRQVSSIFSMLRLRMSLTTPTITVDRECGCNSPAKAMPPSGVSKLMRWPIASRPGQNFLAVASLTIAGAPSKSLPSRTSCSVKFLPRNMGMPMVSKKFGMTRV